MRWLVVFVVLLATLMTCGSVSAGGGVPSTVGPECWGCATAYEKSYNRALIYHEFGYGYAGRTAVCIAIRESGLNHRAFNHRDSNGGSVSLFQINGVWWRHYHVSPSMLKDPRVAVRIADVMSTDSHGGRNWHAWGGSC